jgi:predicted PurR-regulated permease PerM
MPRPRRPAHEYQPIDPILDLLHQVLLPFVAGMVLAYLLDPLANRIERLGVNRAVATLAIIAFAVALITVMIILTVPVIIRELSHFAERFPLYVRRVHTLATDPDRPWLSKLVGEGLGEAERSIGELTTFASSWLDSMLRSAWSGGRALISILSIGIVTPIVACYLLYDWNKMVATIDNWVGFVRGQSTLCLVLAVYYAVALRLIGLEHGILIGITAGLISFIPYLGALSGLVVSTCIAIAQFWPDWRLIWLVPAVFVIGQTLADYVLAAFFGGPTRASERSLGDVRTVCLRLFVRVCRSVDRGAARFCHWCADPFCLENLLCKFALRVDRDKAAPRILRLGATTSRPVASADFFGPTRKWVNARRN